MTTETDGPTLTEFLLARIAEDERKWGNPASLRISGPDLSALVLRMRAECEAKRRIVECLAKARQTGSSESWGLISALFALAAVYADHPDYRDEWRRQTFTRAGAS